MTLSAQEFLRRFLLHVLPGGFVRIRSFGFLANRRRATLLPHCQRLLLENPKASRTRNEIQAVLFRFLALSHAPSDSNLMTVKIDRYIPFRERLP